MLVVLLCSSIPCHKREKKQKNWKLEENQCPSKNTITTTSTSTTTTTATATDNNNNNNNNNEHKCTVNKRCPEEKAILKTDKSTLKKLWNSFS